MGVEGQTLRQKQCLGKRSGRAGAEMGWEASHCAVQAVSLIYVPIFQYTHSLEQSH